ncbi:MAG: hypothetical protein WAU25_00515 [Nitrososphaeraceae archaeon]
MNKVKPEAGGYFMPIDVAYTFSARNSKSRDHCPVPRHHLLIGNVVRRLNMIIVGITSTLSVTLILKYMRIHHICI